MEHPRWPIFAISLVLALATQIGATSVDSGGSDRQRLADDAMLAGVQSGATSLSSLPQLDEGHLVDAVRRLNEEILWAPAGLNADPINRFGDEARSVFGPIPDGDCTGPESKRLGLEVDGNSVELEPNPFEPGSPLKFSHRDADGRLVKWTKEITKCDKPSLAGGVTFCGLNSRISRVQRNHVEWLFLCRKSSGDLKVHADPYWTESDPRFSRYSAIGFNSVTGEIAFLDGRKDRAVFDWSNSFPPPGGQSYGDTIGRRDAEALYDKTFAVDCVSCHDNKKPTVIDPHIQQARVGYFDSRARSFSLGNFLTARIARVDLPFRVIGSGYVSTHGVSMARAKAFAIKGHPCFACHSLTTMESGKRFAADAVAMPAGVKDPTLGQSVGIVQENAALQPVQDHRTDWASTSGDGRIMPWMVPDHGGNLSKGSSRLTAAEWDQLSECAWENGGKTCNYRPLFTGCPAPGAGADTFVPFDFSIAPMTMANTDGFQSALHLTWRYLNGYGDVPERDDVRFDIAVREKEIPVAQAPPATTDYPSMADVKATEASPSLGSVFKLRNDTLLLLNASYSGHRKWSDTPPAKGPRSYSITIPAVCGKRYLIRVVPKRFCFDNTGVVYGHADHLVDYDFPCAR